MMPLRRILIIILIAAISSTVKATCLDQTLPYLALCSGHGTCTIDSTCECDENWTGAGIFYDQRNQDCDTNVLAVYILCICLVAVASLNVLLSFIQFFRLRLYERSNAKKFRLQIFTTVCGVLQASFFGAFFGLYIWGSDNYIYSSLASVFTFFIAWLSFIGWAFLAVYIGLNLQFKSSLGVVKNKPKVYYSMLVASSTIAALCGGVYSFGVYLSVDTSMQIAFLRFLVVIVLVFFSSLVITVVSLLTHLINVMSKHTANNPQFDSSRGIQAAIVKLRKMRFIFGFTLPPMLLACIVMLILPVLVSYIVTINFFVAQCNGIMLQLFVLFPKKNTKKKEHSMSGPTTAMDKLDSVE